MLTIRGAVGDKEVARSALTEVVRNVPQSVDQGPSFLLEVKTVAIVAPELDPALATYQPYRPPVLFELETELISKYQARLQAIETTLKLKEEMNSAPTESVRKSKKIEFDFAKNTESRQFETQKQVGQKELARIADEESKVKILMSQVKLTNAQEARFYLESQNWNVQAALNFITQTVAKPTSEFVTVNFRLPGNDTFSDRFEKGNVTWAMLTVVYKYLERRRTKRNFRLKYQGQVLSEERLSSTTFEALGVGAICDIEVVWA